MVGVKARSRRAIRLPEPEKVEALTRPFSRLLSLPVFFSAFLALLFEAPGKIVFETKLDLLVDPFDFLKSLWTLWNPSRYFGVLQDQYQGYAWPIGPYYALAHLLHLPAWVAERAWVAFVITLGFTGMVRLCEFLGVGYRGTRLAAAAAFSLWPTFTGLAGSTSGAILPGVLLPYLLLALLKGLSIGYSPLKQAVIAAAILASMGGINATSTLDCLVLPAVLFLTTRPDKRFFELLRYSVLFMFLGIAWWFIPLIFLGAYGFNFLPYVEQAHTTFSTMSLTEALRGMGDWTTYLLFGFLHHSAIEVLAGGGNPSPTLDASHPWLPAGWTLASNPFSISASIALAAVGLIGLSRPELPRRRMFVIGALLSLFVMESGYFGPVGSLISGPAQRIFDGPLAPFRNIYKFNPTLAVCLAVGFCHAAGYLVRYFELHLNPFIRSMRSYTLRLLSAALFIPLALPWLSGQILNPGAFKAIPSYWQQAISYLHQISPHETTLVVPAMDQGVFTWGEPVDEPLEALNAAPWAALDQVPFGGAGSRRVLDKFELALKTGVVPPSLGDWLARAGVRYVLVRNDIDWRQFDDPSPAQVHYVLAQAGFVRVAAFGPEIPSGDYVTTAPPGLKEPRAPKYPAVEIFSTATGSSDAGNYPIELLNLSEALEVSGGEGSLADLTSLGLISPTSPVFLTGDPKKVSRYAGLIVTDSLQRREVDFGLLNDNASYVLGKNEPPPPDSPGGEGSQVLRQILPFKADSHQTYAAYSGIKSVSASSYGSWYFSLPQYGPYSALDSNPDTAWVTGSATSVVGQWLRITLLKPVQVPYLGIELLTGDIPNRPVATELTVTTQGGSVTSALKDSSSLQYIAVPRGKTTFIKLTIAAAKGFVPGGPGVGIREVVIPGLTPRQYLVSPNDARPRASEPVAFSFDAGLKNPDFTAGGYYPQLSRKFYLPHSETLILSGFALPKPGETLNSLITPAYPVRIKASSTYADLPRFQPYNLIEAGFPSAWISNERHPSLEIDLPQPATVSELRLLRTGNFASYPLEVTVTAGGRSQTATIGSDGLVRIDPVTASTFLLSFPKVAAIKGVDPLTGYSSLLPLGLKGIDFPQLKGFLQPPPQLNQAVSLDCGAGPTIEIDGHPIATSISGTYGDLIEPAVVSLKACGSITLTRGWHVLTSLSGAAFSPALISLTPSNWPSSPAAAAPPQVLSYSAENMTLSLPYSSGPRVLVIHQNFNSGWRASLGTTVLKPVDVDGWQQGFVVPAGASGVVEITYQPSFLYRIAFGSSLAALTLILLAALYMSLRKGHYFGTDLPPSHESFFIKDFLLFFILFGVSLLITGPAALLVPVAAQLLYNAGPRSQKLRTTAIALCLGLDAIVCVVHVGFNASSQTGSFSTLAQILALASLAFAFSPAINWFAVAAAPFAEAIYRYRRWSYLRYRKKYPIDPILRK